MRATENRDLDALFAAAAAPAFPEECDEQVLDVVLAAFNAAGLAECEDGREASAAAGRPARMPRRGALLIARSAATIVIAAAGGMAAAGAGILPASAQSLAHQYFGGIGVPAPDADGPAQGTAPASTSPTASSSATQHVPARSGGATTAPPTAGGSATPSAVSSKLLSLCSQVNGGDGDWQNQLSGEDLALLTAAAGPEKIGPYCANLAAGAQGSATPSTGESGQSPDPSSSSPGPGGPSDGATPSASPSAPNGDGHGGNGGGGQGGGGGGGNGGRGGNGVGFIVPSGLNGPRASGGPSPSPSPSPSPKS